MKALVLQAYNRFVLEEVPRPAIGPDDVLVAVKACGICGSDVHGMDGSTGRRRPPIVMGHEAAGVIAEAGAGVTGWAPGDRVTFDSTVYCGACGYCREGRVNLCDRRRVLGVSCEEYRRDGAFAEYVAVPQRILYRLPDAVSFEQAAMIEALSIAVHAAGRAPVAPGGTAVVVGAGMIGLLVIQALRAAGCGAIVAVDVDPARLEMAGRMGADAGVKADDPGAVEAVQRRTGGRGADLAFEVVGIEPAVRTAVGVLRKGGHLVLVGNLAAKVELPLQGVVTRELTLHGSCASAGEYPACLDLIASRRVDVGPLISAVAPLAEGPAWFERLHRREPGLLKVILRP
jgi:L-iditol 2-dehydrogenase